MNGELYMSDKVEVSNRLIGYFLALFCLFLGFFLLLLQGEWGWLRYISLIPLTFGFIALAVQLSEDENNNAAIFSIGLNFFAWSYVFGNAEGLIGHLILATLLALALSIFVVSILMSFKSAKGSDNKLDEKSIGQYIFRVAEFVIALSVLVDLVKTVIQFL